MGIKHYSIANIETSGHLKFSNSERVWNVHQMLDWKITSQCFFFSKLFPVEVAPHGCIYLKGYYLESFIGHVPAQPVSLMCLNLELFTCLRCLELQPSLYKLERKSWSFIKFMACTVRHLPSYNIKGSHYLWFSNNKRNILTFLLTVWFFSLAN